MTPSNTFKNTNQIIIILSIIFSLVFISVLGFILQKNLSVDAPQNPNDNNIVNKITGSTQALAFEKFNSCEDVVNNIEDYYKQNQSTGLYRSDVMTMSKEMSSSAPMAVSDSFQNSTGSSPQFSGTNNQVQNVDEGDIVKTDGKNIYTVNGRNVNITSVENSTGKLSKISKIALSDKLSQVTQLNLYQNYLLIVGSGLYGDFGNVTVVDIYDISKPSNPTLVREVATDGNAVSTRMVGGVVYVVNNFYNYQIYPYPINYNNTFKGLSSSSGFSTPEPTQADKIANISKNLPKYYDSNDSSSRVLMPCDQIKFIKPIPSLNFMTVLALDLKNPKSQIGKEVVMGNSENIYASEKNLYLTQTNYKYNYGNDKQTTNIFKFKLSGTEVKFVTQGEVKGTILNQFSMDEFENNFRIATNLIQYNSNPGILSSIFPSTGGSTGTSGQTNNIYILDENLKPVGQIENLARGEKIYSVRFMGKKGYMVTFKKTDPLFTFDLSNPKEPKVLGELKIPGFSDYLHPISENLIIGVGKNAIEAVDGFGDSQGFAWYQGLKLGLFDVTDLNNPKQLSDVEIGDRGTDSAVLTDHKALLWDERNNLLTIPVTLMLIPEEQKVEQQKNIANGAASYPLYGQFKYQGAYVYEVTPDSGFKLKGRVSHIETKAKPDKITTGQPKQFDQYGQLIDPSQTVQKDQETDPSKVTISDKRLQSDGKTVEDSYLCSGRDNETRINKTYSTDFKLIEEDIYPNKTSNRIHRNYDNSGNIVSTNYYTAEFENAVKMSETELKQFEKDLVNGSYKCAVKPVTIQSPSPASTSTSSIAIGEPYYGNDDYSFYINRELYINDYLITASQKQVQSNKIQDLSLVNNLLLTNN